MKSEGPVSTKLSHARHDLLRGDSVFAFLIFMVVGIFLVNVLVSVWHNIRFQRDVREKAAVQDVKSIGEMLGKTSEALLAASEVSLVRRTVMEAGLEHHWTSCSIVLPDGGILADSDPTRITVVELPASWPATVQAYSVSIKDGEAQFVFPLEVRGKGNASLRIAARMEAQTRSDVESQTTLMAMACLALATMLLVHRHARFRLKAIGAIHEALLAIKDGESDVQALRLDPRLGREAQAWNSLLGQREGQQINQALAQVKESLQDKASPKGDLAVACDALPHGLLLVGQHGRPEYANGAAAALLQTARPELLQKNLASVVQDPRVVDAILAASKDPTASRTVIEVDPEGGEASTVLRFTIRPLAREDGPMAMVLIDDVTQQKVADASRDGFLARAAHELRTPLTNIQLYTERALEDRDRDLAVVATCLNVVNEESRRLERIVAEILSIAEIEAGSFRPRRDDVRLDLILQQLKADHTPAAKEKKIKLTFDVPPKLPVLYADRDKVALALHNLVGNALKYTPEKGQVRVVLREEPDQLQIIVSDNGIGIGPNDLPRIFDKFYRAQDTRVATIKGTGLGLAIAREVIRLHGGDITVESKLDNGSTFTLTLPKTQEVAASEPSGTAVRGG
jgi:signal transduction histidine kinase